MTKLTTEINADNAVAHIKESFAENDPLWAIARALQSIAMTQTFILSRTNVDLVGLTKVQQEILTELRKANTSGTVTAKMIRNGQTLFGTTPHEIADAPADSTKHPQQDKNTPHEDWPGHCGMEPDWPRDQPG